MTYEIVESYNGYNPPFRIKPIVEDLLKCLPQKYLRGLNTIVLTDAAGRPRRERRRKTRSRGKKVALNGCLGFYQPVPRGQKPYIQLYVDNILRGCRRAGMPLGLLTRPFSRRLRFASTLYHEIGHHIHRTQRPEHREPEIVAEKYKYQFLVDFAAKRWYLALLALLGALLHPGFWRRIAQQRRLMKRFREQETAKRAKRKALERSRKARRRKKRGQ